MHPTLDQVCQKALSLPCSPALLPRLNAVLANPDATVDEMEDILRVDPVLAASTIRLANSAFFASSHSPVESVAEAVMRLGLREVYRLAAMAVAGRWMTFNADGYRWEPGDFFRVSLVTAIAAEHLAEDGVVVEPRHAYTAGLVSEIGKLAIAYSCSQAFPQIRARQQEFDCPWIEAEQAVLGYNYAAAGAALLRQWKFPEPYIAVAQHNPPGAGLPEAHCALAAHVHAAKYLACALGPGQGEDGFLFSLNQTLLTEHGLTSERLEAAMPEVLERSERILREKFAVGKITI